MKWFKKIIVYIDNDKNLDCLILKLSFIAIAMSIDIIVMDSLNEMFGIPFDLFSDIYLVIIVAVSVICGIVNMVRR